MTAPGDASFLRWVGELVPRLGTVARCHLPGAPIDARRRELVSAAVADAMGSEVLSHLHTDWHHFLGPADLGEIDDEVLAWVQAVIAVEPHLDLGDLPDEVSPGARSALAALVAHGVVAASTLAHLGSLVDQVRGRRSFQPRRLLADATALVVGTPLSAPPMVIGALLGGFGRVAPSAVTIEVDPGANLMSQLLAETLPNWLGSAWGRTLVVGLPVEVPVAVRSGRTGSTVRIGRGRVQVTDGIATDIWALFDGDVDALVRAGSASLTREVRAARLGR